MMSLERAKDLKGNIIWGEIMEELDRKIHFISQRFPTCTPEQLPMLQLEIRLLNEIKKLPDAIIERESEVEGATGKPSSA